MSLTHDTMAHAAARLLLAEIRQGAALWATSRLTSNTIYWQGMAAWPRPDRAFEDRSTGASLAIEFKPPGQTRREYVTGLGQALSYLQDFEYSALIVPGRSYDDYEIGNHLQSILSQPHLSTTPLALFEYGSQIAAQGDLRTLAPLKVRSSPPPIPRGIGRKVFWGYWRDLSQHDLFAVLSLMDLKSTTLDKAFEKYWTRYAMRGKSLTWEGVPRKAKTASIGSTTYRAEVLNCRLSMRHIGLVDSTGKLTESAFRLIWCGKVYGADSQAFVRMLGGLVLQAGNHLELIFWVEEQQRNVSRVQKHSAAQYYNALDASLVQAGIIAPPAGNAKPAFMRDEPKLWNKLGFLIPSYGTMYFHHDEGLFFNWRQIMSCVDAVGGLGHAP